MITGPYTNTDGGLHPNAVARVVKMTVDLIAGTNTIGVEVYHSMDQAVVPSPAKEGGYGPRAPTRRVTIATPQFVLKGADFAVDPMKIDGWLIGQKQFSGWKELL
jgi:hypothetical protein